jgi:surface protein
VAVLRASDAPVGLGRGKPNRASNTSQPIPWARPTDWVSFTTPTPSEQKVIGNVAVYNQDSNYIAFACTTSDASTYNVNWGDGTSENVASGVTAQKNYTWSSISSSTLTSRGYRQAVITITPTNSGVTFSAVNLNRRHSALNTITTATNPWLDLAVAAPNATTIAFTYDTAGTRTSGMQLCEQVNIVAHNTTNTANLFRECRELQSVPLFNTASVTNTSGMFYDCNSLQSISLFDTSSSTNMANMFRSCGLLLSVPFLNTANVTDMNSMFRVCNLLQTVPFFNTANVTDMNNMFNTCTSITTVPLFNTALVINMSAMFNGCSSLITVPFFNTANVTDMNAMFNGCRSITTVPLFNTASVTNMSSMFINCSSLITVPFFNTANVINISNMFNGATALLNVPLFNTANVTNMNTMFQSCPSIQTVPIFNTAKVTAIGNMFFACTSLQNVPELNLSSINNVNNNPLGLGNPTFNQPCASVGQVKLTGNRWTQSFENCRLGATQLDEMYTALAVLNPNVTNVTRNGSIVTYTVDDIRGFFAGRTVTMTGINPASFNLTSVSVVTVTPTTGNAGTFTVSSAAAGTYVSGGVATLQDNKTITVTSNPGTETDTPSIATNKGWTVTG